MQKETAINNADSFYMISHFKVFSEYLVDVLGDEGDPLS